MKIDKPLAPKQAVEFALAGGVAPHQALERSRLIGREVVDVQVGEALPAFHHEVDEGLERRLLGGRIERPLCVILRLA